MNNHFFLQTLYHKYKESEVLNVSLYVVEIPFYVLGIISGKSPNENTPKNISVLQNEESPKR